MSVVAIGLLISIVLGVGLAVLMDASETARKALYPLIIASQTIPTTALAPLFVPLVWLHDLEQGAGNGADYVFPDHDHGI